MTIAMILVKVTVTILLALVAVRAARRSRASVRHVLLTAAFVVLLILPIASWVTPAVPIVVPAAMQDAIDPQVTEPIADQAPVTFAGSTAGTTVTDQPPGPRFSWSQILFGMWLAGAAFFLGPIVVGLGQVRGLRRSALPWTDGQSRTAEIAFNAGVRRRIQVLLHASLPGPMTCGVIRPAIILPMDAPAWSPEDVQRALVHELEHVRRGDWLSQCFARAVAACYWFHPLVWIAWRQLALEAERACDDAVLRASEAAEYADQLVLLAQRLSTSRQPQLAMANRSDLATRVLAVLDGGQRRGRAGTTCVALATGVGAVLVMTMSPLRVVSAAPQPALGAAKARQTFEVASVKPCDPGARSGARMGGSGTAGSPGSINLDCVRTASLIHMAYVENGEASSDDPIRAWTTIGGRDFSGQTPGPLKVRGGPPWVYSDRFAIEARAPGAAERSRMLGPMLRSLLEERFHLKVRQETEEAPMWALTVASGGSKLTRPAPGDCVAPVFDGEPTLEEYKATLGKLICGRRLGDMSDSTFSWRFGGMPVSELTTVLARELGTYVVDRTGLGGVYSFRLAYALDENTLVGGRPGFTPELSTAPTLFVALEQQLGLKLVKITGPRGFIVIDHIERPAPDLPSVMLAPPGRASGPSR